MKMKKIFCCWCHAEKDMCLLVMPKHVTIMGATNIEVIELLDVSQNRMKCGHSDCSSPLFYIANEPTKLTNEEVYL